MDTSHPSKQTSKSPSISQDSPRGILQGIETHLVLILEINQVGVRAKGLRQLLAQAYMLGYRNQEKAGEPRHHGTLIGLQLELFRAIPIDPRSFHGGLMIKALRQVYEMGITGNQKKYTATDFLKPSLDDSQLEFIF